MKGNDWVSKTVYTSQGMFKTRWPFKKGWWFTDNVYIDNNGIIYWRINRPKGVLMQYPDGTKRLIRSDEFNWKVVPKFKSWEDAMAYRVDWIRRMKRLLGNPDDIEVSKGAWEAAMPKLNPKLLKGKVIITSTPRGSHNWAYDMWQRSHSKSTPSEFETYGIIMP